jgi:hypothetical protein
MNKFRFIDLALCEEWNVRQKLSYENHCSLLSYLWQFITLQIIQRTVQRTLFQELNSIHVKIAIFLSLIKCERHQNKATHQKTTDKVIKIIVSSLTSWKLILLKFFKFISAKEKRQTLFYVNF